MSQNDIAERDSSDRRVSDEAFRAALDELCERDDLVGELARDYRDRQEES